MCTYRVFIFILFSIIIVAWNPVISQTPAVPPGFYSKEKTHEEIIKDPEQQYGITMQGNLDFNNSSTRTHTDWIVSFQPNTSLTIENIGDNAIENPKVIINGRGNWHTLDDFLAEILKDARTDQEKLYSIWYFLTRHLPHDKKIFHNDLHELHDPVKMFNIYGKGLCGDLARVQTCLWKNAGFNEKPPVLRHVHGHTSNEVYFNDSYQLLDIDHWTFYLDRENNYPLGGEPLVRDHFLARREHSHGPEFRSWNSVPATQFGLDDERSVPEFTAGHRIEWTLRPGEKIIHRWENTGKSVAGSPDKKWRSDFYGNSQVVYKPRLTPGQLQSGAEEVQQVSAAASDSGFCSGQSTESYLIYKVESPYVICGGHIKAQLRAAGAEDRITVSFSKDGRRWDEIWNSLDYRWMRGPSPLMEIDQSVDEQIEPYGSAPTYRYWIRIDLSSSKAGGAGLGSLVLKTDLVNFPLSLPSLRLGENTVHYTDDTKAPHAVRVTHRWRECSSLMPPDAPQPVYPGSDSDISDSVVKFRWDPVGGCTTYHLRVSRYADMRYIYRPCFDTIVEDTEFYNPFWGIFSDGEEYYWQVRTRNEYGVWSKWSAVRKFRWQGPHVPVGVQLKKKGDEYELLWQANPRGRRPAYYEVYGSNEKGFSVSREPYKVWKLGRVEGNYVGRTEGVTMTVVSAEGGKPNMNKAFYRVVAVDEGGTSSGCSDYAEMPRPYVYTRPVTEIGAGGKYRYAMKTIESIGDLQKRKPKRKVADIYRYAEKEGYYFTLLEGPAWLRLDNDAGVLTGKPSENDAGSSTVKIRIDTYYPNELAPWMKGAQYYSKRDEIFQRRYIYTFSLDVKPKADLGSPVE